MALPAGEQQQTGAMTHWLALAASLAVPLFLLVNQGPKFWFKPQFVIHRTMGLVFLLQYSLAWYVFITDYPRFASSPLPYTMSATLLIQVGSAIHYFKFLPKLDVKTADPGMYSDKGVLPYDWVKENMFFAIMITWGNIYYHEPSYKVLRLLGPLGVAVEVLLVFFAFEVIRPLFPKTHLRNAFTFRNKTTTAQNSFFYDAMTWTGKIFYMLSKHPIGLFLQYCRFADTISDDMLYWVRWWMLMNIGIHNIGTFVHTLRFKKLISPKLGFSIYIGYWAVSNFAIWKLLPVYFANPGLFITTVLGMLVNFIRTSSVRLAFQALVGMLMLYMRVAS